MINLISKLWGSEEWLVNVNDKFVQYCAKILRLNKGIQCSLHFHAKKDETFYILEGEVLLEVSKNKMLNLEDADIEVYHMKVGDQIRIKPLQPHRFRAYTDKAKILEVSTFHDDKDSYRLEVSKKIEEKT